MTNFLMIKYFTPHTHTMGICTSR